MPATVTHPLSVRPVPNHDATMARVSAGARLHFGFCNLSLSHERLYGAPLGLGLAEPRVVVDAEPDSEITVAVETPTTDSATRNDIREYATTATDLLGVDGAQITVHETLPRHAGLGRSGTQLAAATLAAVAAAHGRTPRPRARPGARRGGRSGVGVATFEAGGFVLDAGHPTARFTTDRPADGEWTVPPVAARHAVPDDWRFLLVRPDADPGRSGDAEDDAMRTAVERAEPGLADRIGGIVTRRVLPRDRDRERRALRRRSRGDRPAQRCVVRRRTGRGLPPAGRRRGRIAVGRRGRVRRRAVVVGPTVYGITDAANATAAASAGERALDEAGVDGSVSVVEAANGGARVTGRVRRAGTANEQQH